MENSPNSKHRGGRGESPELGPRRENAGRAPFAGDTVSLAEKFRRGSANDPQQHLFPDDEAYATYLRYCAMILVPPMTRERWQEESRRIFGQGNSYSAMGHF